MPIVNITSLTYPGVEVFSSLTESQLRNSLGKDRGIFIAESPKVIDVALRSGYEPVSLMCERRHVEGDARAIIERCGDIPVFVGDRNLLASLTGYALTRGVLCAMRRRPCPSIADICGDAHRVVVINGVVDTTNIGAIFRSAAALGIDAVLLTRNSCDPLNRRSIRVSMGSVFLVPWAWTDSPEADLRPLGFKTVAMALTDNCYGNGRRRSAAGSHRCRRLCSPHPNVASGGLAECSSRCGCSVLAIAKTLRELGVLNFEF